MSDRPQQGPAPDPPGLDAVSEERKRDLLARPVEHIDIREFDGRAVLASYRNSALQARALAEAAEIVDEMLRDQDCMVILTLAGSLVSAGLKGAIRTLVECDMVDVIVTTGAVVVDQDFFEALGHRHYIAPGSVDAPEATDEELLRLGIDRIYDTYIDELELQHCDRVVARVLSELEPRPHSSREVMRELGAYLERVAPDAESIVLAAHRRDVPIFVPAMSDSSAGFGAIIHRMQAHRTGTAPLSFDSARDFHELALLKGAQPESGLLMIGGGVPKNFAQDAVVAARLLAETGDDTHDAPDTVSMHKYAVQLTVADPRDGGLSGSTLREAASWGKVSTARERLVFGEATLTLPLLASDVYHRDAWHTRSARRLGRRFGAAVSAPSAERGKS